MLEQVREKNPLTTLGTEDAARVGGSLSRVRTPGTPTLEPFTGPQLGLPGGGAQQGAAVGDGDLLPGPDVSPGLQDQSVLGGGGGAGPVHPAVWITAVVDHGHHGTQTPGRVVPEGVGGEDGLEPG